MGRKNYRIDEVLRGLGRKNDVRIDGFRVLVLTDKVLDKNGTSIPNPEKMNDLGNKSWGKIDFLTHYCNYNVVKVNSFR